MAKSEQNEELVWKGKRAWSYFLGRIVLGLLLLAVGALLIVDPTMRIAGWFVGAIGMLTWLNVWLNRVAWRYTVTTQRAIVERGLLSRNVSEIELVNVRDIQLKQTFLERVFRVGTLEISSAGRDSAEVIFLGIPDPDGVKEYVRQGVRPL
jgi:uncharacterized membrane protein YdbT with pleckstrin-like domain